ncbi:MAG: hypothetical protein HY841_08385 [Bacteroidetes bacterium]|nr:hypothetical protein [Bacteroidota bacterium]
MKIKNCLLLIFAGTIIISNAQTGLTISSVKVDSVSKRNIKSAEWNKATAVSVSVMPQNITNPTLQKPSITDVKVKSINDGKTIGFLLEWTDSTKDIIVETDKFCDQVAIQLPMDIAQNPVFMMGNKNGRVHIIHWKAIWQNDVENGFRDVKDAYPNYWTDIYPMAERQGDGTNGKFARDISALDYSKGMGKNFLPGSYAGNPMSLFDRKDPSEECVAEGFGTLTTQETQNASAWGVWENNTWKVIIARPIKSTDVNDAPIPDNTKIAFAVWNGNTGNIGGRKHYSMWSDLIIQK